MLFQSAIMGWCSSVPTAVKQDVRDAYRRSTACPRRRLSTVLQGPSLKCRASKMPSGEPPSYRSGPVVPQDEVLSVRVIVTESLSRHPPKVIVAVCRRSSSPPADDTIHLVFFKET
ncbi:hypothetical protein E2562_017057 [Oryza meyeriana var. granulata]|uniref:Uncharacterized protein n=1 Tax=Oryza meyeriana var. granulata TaxID=110450 RepID=A0A6G1F8L2_9ORYZ|nr:hypothetical protein E2562_017057 [Oryza meyeriana var. granulata]